MALFFLCIVIMGINDKVLVAGGCLMPDTASSSCLQIDPMQDTTEPMGQAGGAWGKYI